MKKHKNKPLRQTEAKPAPKWFYLVLTGLPVIFFVLLELILRLTGYGLDYTQFKPISNYYPDKLFLNPDLPYKYFYNIDKAPSPLPDGFDKVKKANAFRVFVLGESSAAGWPYVPNASFSRFIKRRLELLYPENTIEVINLGISAINSYTLRDFVPGVIEQQPDLILIYTGHNEYYGALGVGSTSSMGSNRFLTNLYISLKSFKTTKLLQDIISGLYGLISGDQSIKGNESGETLMSRMIGEQSIPLNSELYFAGISQFEGNMNDILKMLSDANVPVIIGTLTSNTLDQKPFVSVKANSLPSADSIFNLAKEKLTLGERNAADSLFLYAKELDALRFRAPGAINKVITELGRKYSLPVANIDSVFRKESPNNIVGYNLTVDHLHPTIEGYRIMGETFFNKMEEHKFLPNGRKIDFFRSIVDSILTANFPFTKIDSTLAEMQIARLTGNFPFVPRGTPNVKMQAFKFENFADSLCLKVIREEIKWEIAHSEMAEWYFNRGNYNAFIKEIDVVIQERPYFDQPYEYLINKLTSVNLAELALPYIKKLHKFKPCYLTYKWLGQIYLHRENASLALNYLLKAVEFSEADYQTWYNLSGAYYLNNKIREAIFSIEKSLALNPDNPKAKNFYTQLKTLK